jgi:hypothetical protein
MKLPSFAISTEPPAAQDTVVVGASDALEFLQAIYQDRQMPLRVRMRAAIEALPFEVPKLSAVAVASKNGNDFASRLERAIARSGVKMIEAKAAE